MVNSSIGETAATECNIATHVGCTIEGLYSADNNFYAKWPNNINDCSGVADLRLNVAGTVIANAGRGMPGHISGTFVNNRTLCANNSTYPSVSFIERPDFLLNYPEMVKVSTKVWQEVAP